MGKSKWDYDSRPAVTRTSASSSSSKKSPDSDLPLSATAPVSSARTSSSEALASGFTAQRKAPGSLPLGSAPGQPSATLRGSKTPGAAPRPGGRGSSSEIADPAVSTMCCFGQSGVALKDVVVDIKSQTTKTIVYCILVLGTDWRVH